MKGIIIWLGKIITNWIYIPRYKQKYDSASYNLKYTKQMTLSTYLFPKIYLYILQDIVMITVSKLANIIKI